MPMTIKQLEAEIRKHEATLRKVRDQIRSLIDVAESMDYEITDAVGSLENAADKLSEVR
jgi:uncharacterized protein Yka (UPF0111/DUF47 family)